MSEKQPSKQKNRFSNLMEYLMDITDVKNYVLARELQYDVSYISKWVSGQMLPSTKTETTVMRGIAHCVVHSGTEEGRAVLLEDYQVNNIKDLEDAIFDNLTAEYNYVIDTQKETGNTIAQKTVFYPKLNMPQYISKMHHPVLRRVKSLDIMALIDLMAIEREYRIQIASMENGLFPEQQEYPSVHYSMLIDITGAEVDSVYDIVFLVNMLTTMTPVDFKLYGTKRARERAMFCVKDDFVISGMLMESNVCMSVTASEDPQNCDAIYRYIHSLCSRERLLFRKTSMTEMIGKNDYVRTILSPNQCLLLGHMTEHFMPDALFDEIATQLQKEETNETISLEELRWYHSLMKRSYEQTPVRIVYIGAAFSEFAVTGELDFYNRSVRLTPMQRLQYMTALYENLSAHENLQFKLVHGRLTSDFLYISSQCMFLSDGTSYLRLGNGCTRNALHIINHFEMKNIFHKFYETVWAGTEEFIISNRENVLAFIEHAIVQARMITKINEA